MKQEQGNPIIVPLSPSQSRAVNDHRRSSSPRIFDVPVYLRISGPLDRDKLTVGLMGLMQRHSALRGALSNRGTEVVQLVYPEPPEEFILFIDLGSDSDIGNDAERLVTLLEYRGMDLGLSDGSFFKTVLARTHEQEHFLILTFDHAIMDAHSMGLIASELFELCRDNDRKLPAAGNFYDFAKDEVIVPRQLDYWMNELNPSPPRPFPDVNYEDNPTAFISGKRVIGNSIDLQDIVYRMARTYKTTPYIILLSVLFGSIWNETSQRDIAVAVPMDNRSSETAFHTVGYLQNLTVVRLELQPCFSLKELVAAVHNKCIRAMENKQVPYSDVVAAAVPEPRQVRNQFAQIGFIYSNEHTEWRLPGLFVEELVRTPPESNIELIVEFENSSCGIGGHATFAQGVLDLEMVDSIIFGMVALAKTLGADSDLTLDQATIL